MNNFNNCKPVSVTHRHTGEIRTYHVNSDGTQVFAAHGRSGKMKQLKISSQQEGYKLVGFNSTLNGGSKVQSLYISQLVWAAWVNDGVWMEANGFDIDHIDDNNLNNNFTNLQRITKRANLKKKTGRKQRRLCSSCSKAVA